MSMILAKLVMGKLKTANETQIGKKQYEFCQNWSTLDARFITRMTIQKCQGPLVAVYIDPAEAYYQDSRIAG